MTTEPCDMDVCIVGGGIGGLAAALSLQRIQCNVKVFERDCDFVDRKQGYGLTLTNNIKGPLAQLGLLDECIAQNCLSKSHYVFGAKGDIMGYYGRAFKGQEEDGKPFVHAVKSNDLSAQGGNRGNLRIPRQDLRQMMMNKLQSDTVQWNRKLIDYIEHDSHVSVHFQCKMNGIITNETITCKLLVGADGVRSSVRRLKDQKENVSHVSPLNYLGVAVIIGLSTISHPLLNSRGFYVLDGTHRMFTMPFTADGKEGNDGNSGEGDKHKGISGSVEMTDDNNVSENDSSAYIANADVASNMQQSSTVPSQPAHCHPSNKRHPSLTMWQLSFSGLTEVEALKLRNECDFNQLITEALRRTEGWFPPVQEMIRQTAPGEVWGTPLYDRNPMQLKGKQQRGSRVTVIGDAAHPMSMFKGQGANQALDDGPLLAHWLTVGASKGKRKREAFSPSSPSLSSSSSSSSSSSVLSAVSAVSSGTTEASVTSAAAITTATSDDSPALDTSVAAVELQPTQHQQHPHQQESPPKNIFQASYLPRDAIYTRVKNFEREMVARTAPKAQGSRDAAHYLHSPAVLNELYGIEGVSVEDLTNLKLLDKLKFEGVTADLGGELDNRVRESLKEYLTTTKG